MTVYELYKSVLESRDFDLAKMEEKIEKSWIEDKLTDEQKAELLALAPTKADELKNLDLLKALSDLQTKVALIESKLFVDHRDTEVWTQGMSVAKGQTVLCDVDGDGAYDFCLYEGGRDYTGLSIGKIDGWFKTDANGVKTHTITRDGSKYVLTPIETES